VCEHLRLKQPVSASLLRVAARPCAGTALADPTKPPLRIGLLIASLEVGGAQRAILSLALRLLRAGHDVRVILVDDVQLIELPGEPLQREAIRRSTRVLVKSPGFLRRLGTIGKLFGLAISIPRFRALVKKEELSLVISFLERANILNLMAANGVPRIISVRKHMPMALSEKSWLKRNLIRSAYPMLLSRATAVVCNARESADGFVSLFSPSSARIVTIFNSVDADKLRSIDGRCFKFDATPAQPPIVAAMGRLKSAKGFVPLLRCFVRVRESFPGARLLILGDGPQRKQLQRLTAKLGLDDSVALAGHCKDPYPAIADADVFALPSRAEGFPNALLEAMALGVPVIAADCPSGPREILQPDSNPQHKAEQLEWAAYGALSPQMPEQEPGAGQPLSTSERAFAEGLCRLLGDPSLRRHYSEAGRQRASDFDAEQICQQWQALIQDAMAQDDKRQRLGMLKN